MCTNKITAKVRIPFSHTEPDLNNNIYAEGACKKLVESFHHPLPVKYWIGEHQVEVGVVTGVSCEIDESGNEVMVCDCEFYAGGTREIGAITQKDEGEEYTKVLSGVLAGIGMQSLYIPTSVMPEE